MVGLYCTHCTCSPGPEKILQHSRRNWGKLVAHDWPEDLQTEEELGEAAGYWQPPDLFHLCYRDEVEDRLPDMQCTLGSTSQPPAVTSQVVILQDKFRRPMESFLWSWTPRHCNLFYLRPSYVGPSSDLPNLLGELSGKRLLFVEDSIAQEHFRS